LGVQPPFGVSLVHGPSVAFEPRSYLGGEVRRELTAEVSLYQRQRPIVVALQGEPTGGDRGGAHLD